MSLKKQQGEKTKGELIKFARTLFSRDGFSRTRFDEVALAQGLTIGALYHHFQNKEQLFESVFESCSVEIAQKVFQSASQEETCIQGIVTGCLTYIETVISPKYQKIMLQDSMSVLGWAKWKEIDDRTSESGLLEAVEEAQKNGELTAKIPSRALARFVSGGTNELALWASAGKDKKPKLMEAKKVLETVLNGLK